MTKRIQVDLADDQVEALDKIAGELRRSRKNYKIGIATVVSELISGILRNETDVVRTLKEQAAEYKISPKKADAQPRRTKAAQQSD